MNIPESRPSPRVWDESSRIASLGCSWPIIFSSGSTISSMSMMPRMANNSSKTTRNLNFHPDLAAGFRSASFDESSADSRYTFERMIVSKDTIYDIYILILVAF
ncbi:unnamed protein product [Trichogramma brassicae]|uniref:Uncharacterized protein n=1 Tax=Trichogramma brassicae TaxID=86971 RepID=A0A6H5J852_9HYME|nr:unnamed protein product [Trichogramma brassicae]